MSETKLPCGESFRDNGKEAALSTTQRHILEHKRDRNFRCILFSCFWYLLLHYIPSGLLLIAGGSSAGREWHQRHEVVVRGQHNVTNEQSGAQQVTQKRRERRRKTHRIFMGGVRAEIYIHGVRFFLYICFLSFRVVPNGTRYTYIYIYISSIEALRRLNICTPRKCKISIIVVLIFKRHSQICDCLFFSFQIFKVAPILDCQSSFDVDLRGSHAQQDAS